MRNTLRMITVLTVVGFISGATLVLMYNYASPLIAQNQKNETKEAIYKIFPDTKTYEEEKVGDNVVFKVQTKKGGKAGYAFIAEGNGYQGPITMMVGIKPDLETLVGIEILDSQETPGLGQEISQDKFKSQFAGLKALPEITYVKNEKPTKPNEIEAITGATVSSKAVVLILNTKIQDLRKKLK